MQTSRDNPDWIEQVCWNSDGLVPAVAQDSASGRLLTLAWMNRAALAATVAEGRAVYWSRSRACLWRKGEQSGHVQHLDEVRLDCDRDAVLLRVRPQHGIACHTGRASCFFHRLDNGRWQAVDPVLGKPAAGSNEAG
jgi:phosphoribosyl-AMP cyclohydrolase